MNPVALAHRVEESYRRYLRTTFYFKDPELRASFEDALRSGHLSKGPYLEATPTFKRGTIPGKLFEQLLQDVPDKGFLKALMGDRPLYVHQEEATRRVFGKDRNAVVATGTGSGKTEAFLYPILLHLYREFQTGTICPGIRAMILYPMNALANDQRERLGEICQRLAKYNSPFRFTFGQYIGETPEDESDSQRHAADYLANRFAGELVLRSEIRITPPHILLTNYSMLEYLLLRPDDSPLFDDGHAQWWTFIVLDEAHQYRGAKGIEMAMLMRRLKQRLWAGGCKRQLRCIATSATLMGGKEDTSSVAGFASNLFGEPFDEQDVILGETEAVPESSEVTLDRQDYGCLLRSLESGAPEQLDKIAVKVKLSNPDDADSQQIVGQILQQDARAGALRRFITGNPGEVKAIADHIFADISISQRIDALSELVALLVKAKDPASGAPLLSGRYHLFLRSLEGAFLTFHPRRSVILDRSSIADEMLFEIGLCRECGQHYIVGKIVNEKLVEAVRDPGRSDFGATFFLPADDKPASGEEAHECIGQGFKLCVRCGEIQLSTKELHCGHHREILVYRQKEAEEREDQVPRCAACGYQAPDPVREVVHGTDGPHAVIATTLHQELPETRRKILAFADGRQDAAFFAWYLDNSYRDILARNLLLRVAERQAGRARRGSSLQDLAIGLRDVLRDKNVFPSTTSDLQLLRAAWLSVYREFLTDEPRLSLAGVGTVRWTLEWPDWLRIPQALRVAPWSLSDKEVRQIVLILLDSMRGDRAVELNTDSEVALNWSDLRLQATQMRFRIGPPAGQKDVRSWDGVPGKRVQFLAKLLRKIGPGIAVQTAMDYAGTAAREVWQALWQCDELAATPYDRLLTPAGDARRLNPDWWRLQFVEQGDAVFQCDSCGRIQSHSVHSTCPRHRCQGSLHRIQRTALDFNHYRNLYEAELPGSLRVEEHTAQLDKEKAREFQRRFQEGKIHVLSCSTTFELGVDLGDLDTIFLRNVPPEAFNYAQRVGRSGRRGGHPGIAITYCRRRPHDLYHFSDPQSMLTGRTQPPALAMCNSKIILRHITAVALSCFFRVFKERFSRVENLFGDLGSPHGVADIRDFLFREQLQVEQAIRTILPHEMGTQLGLSDGSWVQRITDQDSRLWLAEAEVSSDYRTVLSLEEHAGRQRDYRTAEWARRRADTIAGEAVLSFLSRKAVIPKYGFPVDVVELDTQRTHGNQESFEVSLQRDLRIAISEFAPTSRLVANKKEWTSYGLKKVAEKEWDRRLYAKCTTHNVFRMWEDKPEATLPCGCRSRIRRYIIPQFGFVTGRDKPKEPKARTAKIFSTRPYFGRSLASEAGIIPVPAANPLINVRKASPGLMVVLCEGRRGEGFYVCSVCGAGHRSRKKQHKTPQGQDCCGTLDLASLGHEFVTDVLQLQFLRAPQKSADLFSFASSLAFAIVEGAAGVLEVPSTDLNTTVAYDDRLPLPPIILYDDVPGGAGLVAKLEKEDVLMDCLKAASDRVAGACGCAPNTSCYGCLRSYRNQFAHESLQRGPVHQYLSEILSIWNPVHPVSADAGLCPQ